MNVILLLVIRVEDKLKSFDKSVRNASKYLPLSTADFHFLTFLTQEDIAVYYNVF